MEAYTVMSGSEAMVRFIWTLSLAYLVHCALCAANNE